MKTLFKLYYWLILPDYNESIKSAQSVSKMIQDSTDGKISHFYNHHGEQIRGYHKPSTKFFPNFEQHPLISKYS